MTFHRPPVNKTALVQKIIAQLTAELEASIQSARAAHAEATDEQSKAENKYDTRGLEASYLAKGQSRHAAETRDAIAQFSSMDLWGFKETHAIDLGALVELETKTGRMLYFLGPRAGGTEVVMEGKEVWVITPQSPLGQQLLGKKQGDQIAGRNGPSRIVSVS